MPENPGKFCKEHALHLNTRVLYVKTCNDSKIILLSCSKFTRFDRLDWKGDISCKIIGKQTWIYIFILHCRNRAVISGIKI